MAVLQCCFGKTAVCAANKLRAVEEGEKSMERDGKLAIAASSGKAQFGSAEHIQEVENRRAVKVSTVQLA